MKKANFLEWYAEETDALILKQPEAAEEIYTAAFSNPNVMFIHWDRYVDYCAANKIIQLDATPYRLELPTTD